jgi:hypothetical protein
MVPGRKGIAFVEYTDDASSTVARDKLHNIKYGGSEDGPRVKVRHCAFYWRKHSLTPRAGHVRQGVA